MTSVTTVTHGGGDGALHVLGRGLLGERDPEPPERAEAQAHGLPAPVLGLCAADAEPVDLDLVEDRGRMGGEHAHELINTAEITDEAGRERSADHTGGDSRGGAAVRAQGQRQPLTGRVEHEASVSFYGDQNTSPARTPI